MTLKELKSLRPGDLVVVNGREEHIGHDKGTFVPDMERCIGKMFRVKELSFDTVRLMDDYGKDIGWHWYPSHLTRVAEEIFDPIPETELMNLIYGA